jgi:ATPase family associated with various cellular activities (AAA)/Winged helix domain, variant
MNDLSQWQKNNDEYLAKSLAWLRLRLARLAQQCGAPRAAHAGSASSPARPESPAESQSSGWRSRGRSTAKDVAAEPPLPPPAPGNINAAADADEEIAKAAAEMSAAEAVTPPPALAILSRNFDLSRFEQEILLLCAAMELDTRTAALCARAQDDPVRPYPTFALTMALFEDPAWDALSPEGPLRHWRMIEINQPGAQPLVTSALRADERIVNLLKGLNYLDDRLAPLFFPVAFDELDAALPPSQQSAVETILRQLKQASATQHLPIIQLAGSDAPSKQMIALRVASGLGLRLYRLPVELMPAHAGELETLARLVEREIALWPFALYLDAHEVEMSAPTEGHAPPLNRFLARTGGVCFIDTQEIRHGLNRASITLDITRPTQAEQQAAWAETLSENADGIPASLAGQFDLNLATIHRIACTASPESVDDDKPIGERLWNSCLLSVRPRLDRLAQRIEPKATWDDIVLPETELKLLRQIAAQVRQRGRVYLDWGFAAARTRGLSINALFAGESGTGKTMAAEVIANDLRLDLYRIDLSAVVNKYIGETEKNLRRVFDAAECGGVILFFDEADALFGKRSEVKDSHDRYANIEINYLLQRLESYRGLAILATNMRGALDTAFMRRIRFIVEFRPHGVSERAAIWQRIFPPETKTFGLDCDRLAKLNLNGGGINNVAINAAFLAAEADTPVTMSLVLDAARTEFLKLKRPINDADFRWEESVAAVA